MYTAVKEISHLLIVGIVLLGKGGHQAHLKLFNFAVVPMSRDAFFLERGVVDIIQSGYQNKLRVERDRKEATVAEYG